MGPIDKIQMRIQSLSSWTLWRSDAGFLQGHIKSTRGTNHMRRWRPPLLYNYALVPHWKDWKGSLLCNQGEHLCLLQCVEEKTSEIGGEPSSQWRCPKQFPPFNLKRWLLFLNHIWLLTITYSMWRFVRWVCFIQDTVQAVLIHEIPYFPVQLSQISLKTCKGS